MPLLPSALPPKGEARCLRDDEKRRILLAPHRGSSPKGLCKRTGFLGVKRRENPVRRHFERSEMRGLRSGIACKCWNIDSIGLFNIARYTASMPLLPSALPPKGEASHYGTNNFLDLIALPSCSHDQKPPCFGRAVFSSAMYYSYSITMRRSPDSMR